MDVFQHGSSSSYTPDGPDFLIAQHHLQVVADLLAGTTFQTMDEDPRADATASLSAIRAILSPESREARAELAEEAQMQIKAKVPIGAVDGVDIGDTGGHSSVTAGDGMGAIGATDSAGIRPPGIHTGVVTDGQTGGTAGGAGAAAGAASDSAVPIISIRLSTPQPPSGSIAFSSAASVSGCSCRTTTLRRHAARRGEARGL